MRARLLIESDTHPNATFRFAGWFSPTGAHCTIDSWRVPFRMALLFCINTWKGEQAFSHSMAPFRPILGHINVVSLGGSHRQRKLLRLPLWIPPVSGRCVSGAVCVGVSQWGTANHVVTVKVGGILISVKLSTFATIHTHQPALWRTASRHEHGCCHVISSLVCLVAMDNWRSPADYYLPIDALCLTAVGNWTIYSTPKLAATCQSVPPVFCDYLFNYLK